MTGLLKLNSRDHVRPPTADPKFPLSTSPSSFSALAISMRRLAIIAGLRRDGTLLPPAQSAARADLNSLLFGRTDR